MKKTTECTEKNNQGQVLDRENVGNCLAIRRKELRSRRPFALFFVIPEFLRQAQDGEPFRLSLRAVSEIKLRKSKLNRVSKSFYIRYPPTRV